MLERPRDRAPFAAFDSFATSGAVLREWRFASLCLRRSYSGFNSVRTERAYRFRPSRCELCCVVGLATNPLAIHKCFRLGLVLYGVPIGIRWRPIAAKPFVGVRMAPRWYFFFRSRPLPVCLF